MNRVGLFFALVIILYAVSVAWARFDAQLNPWLKNTKFKWYQIFTTRHSMTIWYVNMIEKDPLMTHLVFAIYSSFASLIIVWALSFR